LNARQAEAVDFFVLDDHGFVRGAEQRGPEHAAYALGSCGEGGASRWSRGGERCPGWPDKSGGPGGTRDAS
jgi:hypothetical protein